MKDDKILSATEKLKEQLIREVRQEVPDWAYVTAILGWEGGNDCELDDASLISEEFRAYLGEHVRHINEAAIYTGGRVFSFEKLAGMTSYIAAQGHDISRTKLNKLLFYCDFVHYFLHGRSISGSRYIHMHYGPVAEYYRETLDTLCEENKLHTSNVRGHDELLAEGGESLDVLSLFEIATIGWVLENFASMTAREISEFSHHERAFRFTRQGEFIPYEFAKYLEKRPDPVPPCKAPQINGH